MRWAQIALGYKLRSIHLTKAEIVRALIIFLNCIAIAKGYHVFSDKMPKAYNGNNTKKQGKNYKFLPCFFVALYRPVCPIGHIVYL